MLIAHLLTLVDLFCTTTGRSRARVATLIFNDGKKFDLIAAGADLNTRRAEAALQWFSDNWPAGLAWPDGIERPEPHKQEVA